MRTQNQETLVIERVVKIHQASQIVATVSCSIVKSEKLFENNQVFSSNWPFSLTSHSLIILWRRNFIQCWSRKIFTEENKDFIFRSCFVVQDWKYVLQCHKVTLPSALYLMLWQCVCFSVHCPSSLFVLRYEWLSFITNWYHERNNFESTKTLRPEVKKKEFCQKVNRNKKYV